MKQKLYQKLSKDLLEAIFKERLENYLEKREKDLQFCVKVGGYENLRDHVLQDMENLNLDEITDLLSDAVTGQVDLMLQERDTPKEA